MLKKLRILFLIVAILSLVALLILQYESKYYGVEDYLILSILISVITYGWMSDLKILSNVILSINILVFVLILLNFVNLLLPDFGVMLFIFLLILCYAALSVKSIIFIKKNIFLKVLTFVVSLVIILIPFTFLFVAMNGIVLTFMPTYAVNILFVCVTLAMIFGLPNSNYPDWSKLHKRLFLKTILIPWIFVFTLSSIKFIVSNEFFFDMIVKDSVNWGMTDYKLKKLPESKN